MREGAPLRPPSRLSLRIKGYRSAVAMGCYWLTHFGMTRRFPSRWPVSEPRSQRGRLPDDLYAYADTPPPNRRARSPFAPNPMTVTDDWPEYIPVTEAEIAVFEAWFGDILEELIQGE